MHYIFILSVVVASFQVQPLEAGLFGLKKTASKNSDANGSVSGSMRNFVLDRMEKASELIKAGDWDAAKLPLDEAISSIEQVYGFDEAAKLARSKWHEEGIKVFKGEPYERAMAYYYRALIYMKEGDFSNARALLQSGKLQDAFAEEDQHQFDFAVLSLLDYWCLLHLNSKDTAEVESSTKALLAEYQALRPERPIPEESDNVLFVVETGTAPRKVLDGISQEKLVYRRGKHFKEEWVSVNVEGVLNSELVPVESVYRQAATRGGRYVDSINQGKANYKEATTDFGAGFSDVGSGAIVLSMGDSTIGGIGAGMSVVGSTVQLIALNAKPKADDRQWSGLPDKIHCLTAFLPEGDYTAKFTFYDSNKLPIKELEKEIDFKVQQNLQPKIIWISTR